MTVLILTPIKMIFKKNEILATNILSIYVKSSTKKYKV